MRLAHRAVDVVEPVAWVVDDTGFPKDGKGSPGVARQYSGTLGKVANCQIGVSVHAVTDTASCPLDWRLFLPTSWDDQAVDEADRPDVVARRDAVLSGTKESAGATHRMYDILLSNVKVDVTVGGSIAAQTPNEYNGDYPESTRWPHLAAYGFFIRHADGVTLRNSSATLANPGARPMTATVDVLTYATG